MAGPRRLRVLFLLPLVFLSLQFAEGDRKISPGPKVANRVLMAAQSSTPTFYNAFDPSFQNPGSMYSSHLNDQHNVDFYDNINTNYRNLDHKDSINKGFSASLSTPNDAFYPNTYNDNYDASKNKLNTNENSADSASDYKPNGGKFSYPTFSPPSTSSQSSFGRNFLPSFEASLPNKEGYYKESPASTGQKSLYGSPSSEKSLYASPSNEQNLYSSPSNEKNLYASNSNEQGSYGYSPSSQVINSPSKPKVSEFDEFAKSHPVSNYDSFFNTPTVTKKFPPLGRPTFPHNDHDLTYGQVQVP